MSIDAAPGLLISLERRPGLRLVDGSGGLDINTAPGLCSAIPEGQGRMDGVYVILDLTRVGFCDSNGLKALVGAAREVEIAGGRLIVIIPGEAPVRRLLTLTGAEEFLPVSHDREQVLA